MTYYLLDSAGQRGPFPPEQLPANGLQAQSLIWCEGMEDWQRADSVAALLPFLAGPAPAAAPAAETAPANAVPGSASQSPSNRVSAGLCGVFLGWAGVHKFLLGLPIPGLVMLGISVAGMLASNYTKGFAFFGFVGMWVIGVVEGIRYLSMSDAEFDRVYVVGKRQWF